LLSAIQEDFLLNSYHSWNILSGSVSAGKTYIVNNKIYPHLYSLPENCLFIIVGRTSESVYDNVIRELLQYDTIEDLQYSKSPQRILIKSKNIEISCIGADNESSWTRVQGKTTAGALFDEITNLPENLVKTVSKGCRHGGQQWPKFATTNPDAPGHWVKEQLIDNKELDSKIWYFKLTDNPVLTEEYKKEIMATYTGAMYERMINGLWVMASGTIYSNFDRRTHVKTKEQLPKFKDYILGCDWGYQHPLALNLYGIDYDGGYWILDEIHLIHQLIDETLLKIIKDKGWLSIEGEYGTRRPSYCYADSARPDYINLFGKLTGITTLPAAKEVHEGISLVQQKLKVKNNGEPSLYILDTCTETIKELELYRWATNRQGTKDEPHKDFDHHLDNLRYCIYTRERARAKVMQNNPFSKSDPFEDWDSIKLI
jgi:PBSX family phage terminase large subunit